MAAEQRWADGGQRAAGRRAPINLIRWAPVLALAAVFLGLPAGAAAGGPLTIPVNTALPAVSGSAVVGAKLTAGTGSWHPTPTGYSYQWQRSAGGTGAWANIPGATASTYVLSSDDAGDEERVTVTATNGAGSASASSVATGVVIGVPVSTAAPSVSGTGTQGATLTAGPGGWSPTPTSYSYQWQRSLGGTGTWTNISGATAATYVLSAADVNCTDRVNVTATDAAGSTTVSSPATALIIAGAPVDTTPPTVTGTAAQGSTLSAYPGTWDPTPDSYTYQWQRSVGGTGAWTHIAGATAASYTALPGDEGAELRVLVTGTNAYGSVSVASAATAPVVSSRPVDLTPPTISGTAAAGHGLTASVGSWSGNGNFYVYQWQLSTNGSRWTNIAGAATSRYSPVAREVGDYLRVIVFAGNPDGSASAASQRLTVTGSAQGKPARADAPASRRHRRATGGRRRREG